MVKPETQKNEYKSSWHDHYYEWISGYANANGGTLYVGVNDDGYVVGLKDSRYLLDTLPNQVNSLMGITISIDHGCAAARGENLKYDEVPCDVAQKPENLYVRGILTKKALEDIEAAPNETRNVSPDVQKLFDSAPGFVKQLRQNEELRKTIKENLDKWLKENPVYVGADGTLEYVWIAVDAFPYGVAYQSRYYKRSGGTTRELTGMELSRFLMDKAGLKWDGMPVKNIAFDKMALDYLREHAVERGRLSEREASVPDEVLIKNLNMINDNGEYTRAAAMLFGDPERIMVGSYIMIGYFAPAGSRGANTAKEVIYQDEIRGPLMLQAEKAMDILYTKYLKALIDYEGIHRVETFMIPRKAMREIILNAITHKNYASGNPIQIKVFDDHITVMNEGFWPFDSLKVEKAYDGEHSSYRSNPLIAFGFYKAGEIETWGQGFEKIKDACKAAGAPLPKIIATPRSVTMVVRGSEHYMRLLEQNLGIQSTPNDFLSHSAIAPEIDSPGKLLAILEFCNEPKSRVQIQEFCGIKSKSYFKTKILSPLLSGGQLVPTIPEKPSSPNQKYVRRTALKTK
jgi:ATP-dependent DNA helicase RecG